MLGLRMTRRRVFSAPPQPKHHRQHDSNPAGAGGAGVCVRNRSTAQCARVPMMSATPEHRMAVPRHRPPTTPPSHPDPGL